VTEPTNTVPEATSTATPTATNSTDATPAPSPSPVAEFYLQVITDAKIPQQNQYATSLGKGAVITFTPSQSSAIKFKLGHYMTAITAAGDKEWFFPYTVPRPDPFKKNDPTDYFKGRRAAIVLFADAGPPGTSFSGLVGEIGTDGFLSVKGPSKFDYLGIQGGALQVLQAEVAGAQYVRLKVIPA
jgi:hypothetical protein